MQKKIVDYTLYKYRYLIGYTLGGLLFIGVLLFVGLYLPGGLRSAEEQSIVDSHLFSITQFDPASIVNAPYHLLQKGVFMLFGVSVFFTKLPSILLAVATIFGLYLLVREWFRENIALITTILTLSLPAFMFVAQDGTPTMYFIALSTWLVTAATYSIRERGFPIVWKIIMFASLALLLYTPLGVYVCALLAIIAFIHPHIRLTLRRISAARYAAGGILGIVLIAPLIYSIARQPDIGLTLLGIPSGAFSLGDNALYVANTLFNFTTATSDTLLHPVFDIGLMLLMLIGLYRFVLLYYTAQAHFVLLSLLIYIPLVILTPAYILYLLPVALLLVAMGIATIVREWYKLFPRNPYARIAGLVPIVGLVALLSVTNLARFGAGYYYLPSVADTFSDDITVVRYASREEPQTTIVISQQEQPLYNAVSHYNDTPISLTAPEKAQRVLYTRAAHATTAAPADMELSDIVVNRSASDANRFYLYKKSTK